MINVTISEIIKRILIAMNGTFLENMFMKMSKDTGLRINANGSIRVNKSVFYSRPEVKNVVAKMRVSPAYPNHKNKCHL